MKISVCMATYNGSQYLKDQISSILEQLGPDDELIVSDDGSTDDTIELLQSFKDNRIVILNHKKTINKKKIYSHYLVSSNFENALKYVSGDVIFLSDQDDIWLDNKVKICLEYLKEYALVMSNCAVIDTNKNIISESFFNSIILPRGLFRNLSYPKYHGCCMAFRKEVLDVALPFPKKMILHDSWIGILAENFGNVIFIQKRLLLYRRHLSNSSFVEGNSQNSFFFKIQYRLIFLCQIITRIIAVKFNSFL